MSASTSGSQSSGSSYTSIDLIEELTPFQKNLSILSSSLDTLLKSNLRLTKTISTFETSLTSYSLPRSTTASPLERFESLLPHLHVSQAGRTIDSKNVYVFLKDVLMTS